MRNLIISCSLWYPAKASRVIGRSFFGSLFGPGTLITTFRHLSLGILPSFCIAWTAALSFGLSPFSIAYHSIIVERSGLIESCFTSNTFLVHCQQGSPHHRVLAMHQWIRAMIIRERYVYYYASAMLWNGAMLTPHAGFTAVDPTHDSVCCALWTHHCAAVST